MEVFGIDPGLVVTEEKTRISTQHIKDDDVCTSPVSLEADYPLPSLVPVEPFKVNSNVSQAGSYDTFQNSQLKCSSGRSEIDPLIFDSSCCRNKEPPYASVFLNLLPRAGTSDEHLDVQQEAKNMESSAEILREAITKVVEQTRTEPIPQEAHEGLVYFIQEMISRVSLAQDWVDTMFQTSSMIKNRRDIIIAHAVSSLKSAHDTSEDESDTLKQTLKSIIKPPKLRPLRVLPANTGKSSGVLVLPKTVNRIKKKAAEPGGELAKANRNGRVKRRVESSSDSEISVVTTRVSAQKLPMDSPPPVPASDTVELVSSPASPSLSPPKIIKRRLSGVSRQKFSKLNY